jgi:hypothetical protein
MSHPDDHARATAKPVFIPTVLAVGCSEALLARTWAAIADLGVMVRDCAPAGAATLAAMRRPLAIVAPRGLDTEELAALARDVRATFVEVDERADEGELARALADAVRGSASRRERRTSTSGRYSILPGALSVSPARSEPPPVSAVRPAGTSLAELAADLPVAAR